MRMNYKLIFVEGLPGTGKTTLSERIYKLLVSQGISAELILESNEKLPSNFWHIAGVPKCDFANFSVDEAVIKQTDGYFFVDMRKCTEDSAKALQIYDIGDEFNKCISSQEYACRTLEWWHSWAADITTESVLVLDSAFMQCPINEMIFRGSSDEEIVSYIQAIAEIIMPLNPVCIYLRRENAKIAIDFAKEAKGEHWTKGVEDLLAQLGYSDLFERRFSLEQSLLSLVPSIVCNIKGNDWSDADAKIRELIISQELT